MPTHSDVDADSHVEWAGFLGGGPVFALAEELSFSAPRRATHRIA